MPFWIAALRHNNLREFSAEGIALDTDSWVGVAKNETSIPIDIDESVDDDEKDECLLLGECLVKRALASLPIYRKLYFALKASCRMTSLKAVKLLYLMSQPMVVNPNQTTQLSERECI